MKINDDKLSKNKPGVDKCCEKNLKDGKLNGGKCSEKKISDDKLNKNKHGDGTCSEKKSVTIYSVQINLVLANAVKEPKRI